jgi:4-hydroxybenzoate polyprenyltransferase
MRDRRFGRVAWALARACHLEPTLAVTAVATALAFSTGRDLPGLFAVAAAVLAGQLTTGWTNDYLDAERDIRVARPDKPVATGAVSRRTVGIAAIVAAVACVPLSFLSGWRAGVLHLVAVGAAAAYNARLKSTVFSPLPYALAFGIAPAFVLLGLPGAPTPPAWPIAAGALLGAGAHFANVLPDLEDDAATGVRGLPQRLGYRVSAVVSAVLLFAAAVVIALGPAGPPRLGGLIAVAATVLILGAGLLAGRRPGSRGPFRAVLAVAVIDVGLLLVSGVGVG